jgi:hypothetical protein
LNILKTKDATKPANAATSTDNEMAVQLIPPHPPMAKLIPQLTTDNMARIKKNLIWKKDFTGVYVWRNCKMTATTKPTVIKDKKLIVKITHLPLIILVINQAKPITIILMIR